MLTFLRTYQKSFLVIVAGAVIVSCFFSGISGFGGFEGREPEEPVGSAVDGSVITRTQIERMVDFLSSSYTDLLDDNISSPNLLSDGVFEKEILGTPVGALLARRVFSSEENDLTSSMAAIRSFNPYRHPSLPALDVSLIWSQVSPEAARVVSSIRQGDTHALSNPFERLSKLYLEQKSVPLVFIRRMMRYQEEQNRSAEKDPGLSYADLSLAGLHSPKQWFGSKYLHAAAELIVNGACEARKRGITVSSSEVRESMMATLGEACRKAGERVDPARLRVLFAEEAVRRGGSEKNCLETGTEIALFRKLLQSFRDDVTIDPERIQTVYEASKQLLTVDLFSLPAPLRFRDFSTLLKWQLYLETVAPSRKGSTLLPETFFSVAEIEKKAEELIRREYVLEYGEVDLRKASAQVGIKEMFAWQTGDLGWGLLRDRFSLTASDVSAPEQRFALLESLGEGKRAEVDMFSREKILASDVDRIRMLLSSAESKRETLLIGNRGEGLPFKDLGNPSELKSLLDSAALQGEEPSSDRAREARDRLLFYRDGEHRLYRVAVISRLAEPEVLSFADADAFGVLRRKLDAKLEALYPSVRKKNNPRYLNANGSWKPLSEVKDLVGLSLFPDLLAGIEEDYRQFYGKTPSDDEKGSPAFYVRYRMLGPLLAKLQSLQQQQEDPPSSDRIPFRLDLVSERQTKKIRDVHPEDRSLQQGQYSPLRWTGSGRELFFKVVERSERESLSDEELEEIAAPLRLEAQKRGIAELLEKIPVPIDRPSGVL